MNVRTKAPRFYSTTKSAQKLVAEILSLLTEFGADSFHVQQKNGEPVAIGFIIHGIPFRYAPDFAGIERRLEKARKSGRIDRRIDPNPVAWHQIRTLLELQLEAVETGIASAETIFAGWALMSTGQTVGEMIAERNYELMPGATLLLQSGNGTPRG